MAARDSSHSAKQPATPTSTFPESSQRRMPHAVPGPSIGSTSASAPDAGPSNGFPASYMAAADRSAFRALMQYADQLDALPLELTRTASDLRELDAVLGGHVSSLTTRMAQLTSLVENRNATPGERLVTLKEVAEEARAYKLGGDDKIRVAVAAADTLAATEKKLDEAFATIAAHPTIAPFADPVAYLRHMGLIPGTVSDLDALARLPGVSPPPPSGASAAAAESLALIAQRTGLPAPSSSMHTASSAPTASATTTTTAAPEGSAGTPKRRGGGKATAQAPPSRSGTPQIEVARRAGTGSRASPTTTGPSTTGGAKKRKAAGADEGGTKKRRNFKANTTQNQNEVNDSLEDSRSGKNETGTPSPHPANAAAALARRQDRGGTPATGQRSPALGGRRPQARGGSAVPNAPEGKGPPPEAVALTAQAGPDEPRYCFCNQVSFGEMIGCDAPDCPREWFHLSCVGLTKTPDDDATWYCAECQARRSTGATTGPNKKKPQTRRR